MQNTIEKGFLATYRQGDGTKFIQLNTGFLRLSYDNKGLLEKAAFVLTKSKGARVVGSQLELSLAIDGLNEDVTYIAPEGVSGLQWSNGKVEWGTTYEYDGSPSNGRTIPLDAWVDERVSKMINKSPEKSR